jgi:hypothetical protein
MQWESQSSCIYPASQHDTPHKVSSSPTPALLNTNSVDSSSGGSSSSYAKHHISSSSHAEQHSSSSNGNRPPLGAITEAPSSDHPVDHEHAERNPADHASADQIPADPPAGYADGFEGVQEWSNVLAVLDDLLLQLHNNWVPRHVVADLFGELFGFVDVQLFNQVMLRRECCSLANAEYVAAGLEQVLRSFQKCREIVCNIAIMRSTLKVLEVEMYLN